MSDDALLDTLVDAFTDDPFYRKLFNAQPVYSVALRPYFSLCLAESRAAGRVDVSEDGIDGAAIWTGCRGEKATAEAFTGRRRGIEKLYGELTLDLFDGMVREMDSQTKNLLPQGAWYLSILGVATRAQGRGLGRILTEKGCEAAAQEGAYAYLETFKPETLPFYERCGFGVLATCHSTIIGRDYWVLGK